MSEQRDRPDDRNLSEWLFQRRRPRRQGRIWTSTTGDRKADTND